MTTNNPPFNNFRLQRWIAWTLWFLTMALAVGSLISAAKGQPGDYNGWGFRGFSAVLAILFAGIGMVILVRQPNHVLAWVFCLVGATSALQASLFEYGIYVLITNPGSLPGGLIVAWILNWLWLLLIFFLALILLLFPDGSIPSLRRRAILYFLVTIVVLQIIIISIIPGPLVSSFPAIENPFGIQSLHGLWANILDTIIGISFILSIVLIASTFLIRFHHSRDLERQQFKWFAYAAILMIFTAPTAASDNLIHQSAFITAIMFLPIAMGIAITRYRLYDIDVIIRRTLVYGVLTVLLALVYFGSVVLLQSLATAISGQQSPIVIVISTLIIAGLFNPLRIRLQDFIDRRFYRRKYDAQRTLADFATTARDGVDLERLTAELVSVVQETMQPAQITLWLREPNENSKLLSSDHSELPIDHERERWKKRIKQSSISLG